MAAHPAALHDASSASSGNVVEATDDVTGISDVAAAMLRGGGEV